MNATQSSRERDAIVVFVLLTLVLWTVFPVLGDRIPPGDNDEQLRWAMHPAWGYDKHPPFPTWVLWVFERFLPTGFGLTYFLGGLQVAVMLACAWILGRGLLDGRRAWIAVLLAGCITYYTARLHFYNHNTVQLAVYAISLCCLWRAVRTDAFAWWAALGACWGAGMLCKYQMVVPIACNLIFLWTIRSIGWARIMRGVLVAAMVSLAIFAPHVVWLMDNDFPTFNYASKSLAAHLGPIGRLKDVAGFLASQAWRLTPAVILSAALLWRGRAATVKAAPSSAPDRHAELLLAVHAWGPLVLMSLLSLFAGVNLQMHWGTAFIWVIPLWFLGTARGQRLASVTVQQALVAAGAVQLLMLAAYLSSTPK
jgi:hypothetical protein